MEMDVPPLWFSNCVTEAAMERACWRIRGSGVSAAARKTETLKDPVLTRISPLPRKP